MLILWLFVAVTIALAVWLAFWMVLSVAVTHSSRQRTFLSGRPLRDPPKGFYRGTAHLLGGRPVPWLGKSFIPEGNLGFNIFTPRGARLLKLLTPLYDRFRVNADGNTEAYTFKTSSGPGFKDRNVDTFKLDYNSPENPFLIRIILDEIVEIAPQQFLGKVHLKVFPGYFATIGYFGLSR